MSLTILDIIVIIVVLISALLAMVRGFVREVLSIASWAIAALSAYAFHDLLRPVVKPYFESLTVATIVSAAAVFFVALLVASYVTMKIADFVIDSRVGAIDRALGFLFGAARGLLLLVIALQFFNWLVPQPPSWVANAQSREFLNDMGESLVSALPEDLEARMQRFRGDDEQAGTAAPNETNAAPAYENSERNGLDQLIQGTNQ
jgi:membrane protein required for colicin V production